MGAPSTPVPAIETYYGDSMNCGSDEDTCFIGLSPMNAGSVYYELISEDMHTWQGDVLGGLSRQWYKFVPTLASLPLCFYALCNLLQS